MKFAGGAASQHCIQRPCARTNASRERVDKAISRKKEKKNAYNASRQLASSSVGMHTTASPVPSVNVISHASDADGFSQRPLGAPRKQGEVTLVRGGGKVGASFIRCQPSWPTCIQSRAVAGHHSSARCRHTPRIQPQHHCHEIRWGSGANTALFRSRARTNGNVWRPDVAVGLFFHNEKLKPGAKG
jgi:hypothetical protein